MERLLTGLLAVCLGFTALLATGHPSPNQAARVQLDADAAFRDGLYVGRLAAERGSAMRPLIGRWSTEADRASFVQGYRRGYGEFIARTARVE